MTQLQIVVVPEILPPRLPDLELMEAPVIIPNRFRGQPSVQPSFVEGNRF